MLHSYTEGRVVLEVAQLRNPIISIAVRKYISKIDGIRQVKVKSGVITIDYDPAILPTRVLLSRGQADLAKYGINIDFPAEMIDALPEA